MKTFIEFEFNRTPKIKTQALSFNWKIFWMTFITVFILVTMQFLGIKPPKLINPQGEVKESVMKIITPKLQKIENTFSLKKTTGLIQQSYAASFYDEAAAYGVIDFESGEIIAQKNLNDTLSIASLTKVMTSVVALDLANINESFRVSQNAADEVPTKIGVELGESLTLEELLNAVLLTSANDAAEVIKEGINKKYGGEVFINAMNEKARYLGLSSSNFENPQGFDGTNHHSSVHDLAVLSHYALSHYPLIAEIVKKDYEYLPQTSTHKQFDLYNWNGLIGVYPNTTGVKIGNTEDAGRTTIVVSQREDKKIMVVLLGTPGILERDLWASQLLDLGFEKTLGLKPVEVTEENLQAKYDSWKYWN